MLVEHLPNGFGGNMGQIRLAQRLPQQHERPRRRLILVAIRHPLHFGQNACLLRTGVRRFATSTSSNGEGCQTVSIEALDQLAHAVSAFQPSFSRGLRKALSTCYCHQGIRSPHHIDTLTTRVDQPTQLFLFLLAQGTQGIFLRRSHERFPSFSLLILPLLHPPTTHLPVDQSVCSCKVIRSSPVRTSQIFRVSSLEQEIIHSPEGLTAHPFTESVCPCKV